MQQTIKTYKKNNKKNKKPTQIPNQLQAKLTSLGAVKGTAFEIVSRARDVKNRISGSDFVNAYIEQYTELHGDRAYGDDKAINGGIGWLGNIPVTAIVLEKGKTTAERIARNFGSAHPEGYRKALRLMQQAEKFGRPIICFVDTTGAYCGIGAEERGQGYAIAQNIMHMMTLKTPILTILMGEGGSGGALALAVADEVWMLQNSIYSVISPEGCASILFKDVSKAPQAAQSLKLTAIDLANYGIIDDIILEEEDMLPKLKKQIIEKLETLQLLDNKTLLQGRYNRFRQIGTILEM
ncbi:MAG: acetyl-CoA carboxylase carboxyl transferase subunit alpha [Firmicutes bacterium]|nr:acetyl-CoA carboxylase carboxyl transferase subunit alpha [Bacillota bacterium]MCL1953787.1 acetyl-CoA carboxylase carboxyl transferase subunit alpha [Bacillota bacterium]